MTNPAEGKAAAIRLISTVTQPGEPPAKHIVNTDGHLIERGGSLWLRFEEEMDGRQVRTTVRMREEDALIMRSGDVSMRLPLVPGEDRPGTYGVGEFSLPLDVRTRSMQFEPGREGRFAAVYELVSNGQTVGTYEIEFTYSEGKR